MKYRPGTPSNFYKLVVTFNKPSSLLSLKLRLNTWEYNIALKVPLQASM